MLLKLIVRIYLLLYLVITTRTVFRNGCKGLGTGIGSRPGICIYDEYGKLYYELVQKLRRREKKKRKGMVNGASVGGE